MNSAARPNLGGLFNGGTSPDRSSAVNGASGPRLVLSRSPLGQDDHETSAESEAASTAPTPPPRADTDDWADRTERPSAFDWIDPLRVVEQYFAFLQAVLDTNRDYALALTTRLISLPRRGRN